MFKAIKYVLEENLKNLYRIFSIAKYEYVADLRDSKFGLFWSFASPIIQVFSFWLVFGIGMSRGDQEGIKYLPWVIVGFSMWWFISPVITGGCNAIFSKNNIITKMKFPVSILPATVVLKEWFNHICVLIIAIFVIFIYGFRPNIYWIGTFYYMVCGFILVWNITLITSVLTMLWRDIRKLVKSLMRLLLYFSPVIWTARFKSLPILNYIMKMNPIYYVVQGYRDSLLFKKSIFAHPVMTGYFWCANLLLFAIGCTLIYKFKKRFIDML